MGPPDADIAREASKAADPVAGVTGCPDDALNRCPQVLEDDV
jgi:hypothetical protein